MDFSAFYEDDTSPEGSVIAHCHEETPAHEKEWERYWQTRMARVLALKVDLSHAAHHNVGLESPIESYVDSFWRQDKERADQSHLRCSERTPIVVEEGNSFVILPKYNIETGEEYLSRGLFFNSAPFLGFLGITQSLLMETTLANFPTRVKFGFLRENALKIRAAIKKKTIFAEDNHYVLISNPGQALREKGIDHPKYSELELKVFKLAPEKVTA